jgi:SAM-dependent methyltransferase
LGGGHVTEQLTAQVVAAVAPVRAARAINADLIAEDIASAVIAYSDVMTNGHAHHGRSHQGDDPADVVMDEAFWDERYRSNGALWSGNPNSHLVTEAADLAPGTALDVGCGEGADAIWLAERGWRVTAVDLSTVALERGAARALEVGADVARRITWLHADLADWVPAAASYDLVSAQFMHLPRDQRELLHRRLAEAVAPGGTLLVVGHHPSDLQTTIPRPPVPELFFTASDVAASLAPEEWVTLVDEARARTVLDADGRKTTIHDAVLRVQRTG